MTTPNDKQLQKDMDEQQEIHERLMIGRDYRVWKRRFVSKDVFLNVVGRGDIFVVSIPEGESIPSKGEVVEIDGMDRVVSSVEVMTNSFGRRSEVGLVTRPIPAPQKQDLPQVDTKTLLRDITALKAKVRELEGEVEAWRKEAIGWRRQRNVSEYRYDIGGK